jgi:phosphatidylserine/phosphatidylglycerophosphate/cardiolipin synthase-like enzyme
VRLWQPGQGKLHAKCLIVDGQRVLSGSFNWTKSAAESNVELLLAFENPGTVKKFSVLFERLWEKRIPMKEPKICRSSGAFEYLRFYFY